ncbi:uncharacterized protein LOC121801491 [Salvia splendens]|uniref:uncharacterized protein LOC121801491 n=1 Tax=Salvia splendens TaxID=180675 RepID=UPI001C25E675|nr:uncharacterized protein LOC121801491 [Salvia splendens]
MLAFINQFLVMAPPIEIPSKSPAVQKASLAVRLLMKGYSLPSRRKQLLLIPGIGPGAPIIFHCEPVLPGCFLRAKAIGLMPMIDQGEKDDKIIAVCADDPEYRHYTDVSRGGSRWG